MPGTLITASLPWKNTVRRYLVHLPTEWRFAEDWAAVLLLHGGGADADSILLMSQMAKVADENRFVVIAPDGYARSPRSTSRTWNALSCCGDALVDHVDEIAFVTKLLEVATRRFSLDPTRIYASGFSNGAMLTHMLGARMSETFAAIAPVSGDLGDLSLAPPKLPVPVIYFQGQVDIYCPYAGGKGLIAPKPVEHNSVAEVTAWWVGADLAPLRPEVVRGDGFVKSTYTPVRRFPEAAPVELYTLPGGGHQWPGGVFRPNLGPIVQQVDASRLIWNFFKRYHR